MLDADYVLILFGGYANYGSDDIAKFLWMVRIAEGDYPHLKEDIYVNEAGDYSIDKSGTQAVFDSMMYRFSYYRFDEFESGDNGFGYDVVRSQQIGLKGFKLRHFQEAYTTENWLLRIYSVNDWPNREIGLRSQFKIRKNNIVSMKMLDGIAFISPPINTIVIKQNENID